MRVNWYSLWVAGLALLTLAFGMMTAFELAAVGETKRGMFYGGLVPALAVADWLWFRRRKWRDPAAAADHMALTMLFLVVCMAHLAR
jgi:hypothetical protein